MGFRVRRPHLGIVVALVVVMAGVITPLAVSPAAAMGTPEPADDCEWYGSASWSRKFDASHVDYGSSTHTLETAEIWSSPNGLSCGASWSRTLDDRYFDSDPQECKDADGNFTHYGTAYSNWVTTADASGSDGSTGATGISSPSSTEWFTQIYAYGSDYQVNQTVESQDGCTGEITYASDSWTDTFGFSLVHGIPECDGALALPGPDVQAMAGECTIVVSDGEAPGYEFEQTTTYSWSFRRTNCDGSIDSDGDRLSDCDEYSRGTVPTNPDTDGDGLSDGDEVHDYGTDPLTWDSDGDAYGDGAEVTAGTDPLNPLSYPGCCADGGGDDDEPPPACLESPELDPVHCYAPEVRLHPDEQYFPMDPNDFIEQSSLRWSHVDCPDHEVAAEGGIDPQLLGSGGYTHEESGPLCLDGDDAYRSDELTRPYAKPRADGLSPEEGFFLDLNNDARHGESPVNGKMQVPMYYNFQPGQYITYWFFYGHDPKALGSVSETVGKVMEHEAEWERIIVRLDANNRATHVEYSQHTCAADVYPWPTAGEGVVQLVDHTHPVVYSAAGAHASYPAANRKTDTASCGKVQGLGDATADGGAKWRPWDGPGLINITTQAWYGYGGAWGEIGAGSLSNLWASLGTGPAGPPHMPPWEINPGGPPANEVVVDDSPPYIYPGDVITFPLWHARPGSRVWLMLFSDPVFLYETTTDSTGTAELTATIPADTPPGDHHLVMLAVNPSGVTEIVEIPIEVVSAVDILGGSAVVPDGIATQIKDLTGRSPARLAGPGRYDTAAAIVADAFPDPVDAVYIATGANFPDALAGGAAAAKFDAPVLLVPPDHVPQVVADQLRRLKPKTVKVLGGAAVVPEAVMAELATVTGVTPIRVAGANRFETAVAIVNDAFPSTVDTVYVATGMNFPDALAGSAAAAKHGAPVLLVAPDGVPTAVGDQLKRLKPKKIKILGGSAVVPDTISAELAQITGLTPVRLAGAGRYETAAAIVKDAFPELVGTVYVATGTNFPDALAGAAAAGKLGAPVLLVPSDSVPTDIAEQLKRLTN